MDHLPVGVMITPFPLTLIDLTVVLAALAWACSFLWRRFRQTRGKQRNACDHCSKCDH
jgi:hypothetical protein